MKPTSTQGFTLIELLVVIAIIGVLAAILLPGYREAQKKPYDVAALQCGKAVTTAVTILRIQNPNLGNTIDETTLGPDVQEACQGHGVQVHHFDSAGLSPSAMGDHQVSYSQGFCFLTWHPSGSQLIEWHGCSEAPSIKQIPW